MYYGIQTGIYYFYHSQVRRTLQNVRPTSLSVSETLYDCYEAEHQQIVETAIEDLTIVCQNHGGELRYN